jgi:hypothetical protein
MIFVCLLGVLGLCAIVLSSPYDIPNHVPEALMLLCEHSHDPDLIQVCLLFEEKKKKIIIMFVYCRNRSRKHYQNFVELIMIRGMNIVKNSLKINL